MTHLFKIFGALALLILAPFAQAQDVWITRELPFVEFEVDGESYVIERNQDNAAVIAPEFAKTSRPCPPFCVQPTQVAEGVKTVTELDVLDFLQDRVANGTGLLIDARTRKFFVTGTIPGAVNIPYKQFSTNADNTDLAGALTQIGGKPAGKDWDFSGAKDLLLFCNGPWCGQSPAAIRNLLKLGFPAEKLLYYRGGMQDWHALGLTVLVP